VNHAVTTATTNTITVDNLSPDLAASDISSEVKVFEKSTPRGEIAVLERPVFLEEELATHEKCLLLAALKKADGVQKRAAELLGINYRSFRHRLEKYSMLGMTLSVNEDQKKSTDKLFGGS
jgi:two-component system response regulator PilR (NtrC family)